MDFFGADRVVFASGYPFDPEGVPMFIREGIRSVEDPAYRRGMSARSISATP